MVVKMQVKLLQVKLVSGLLFILCCSTSYADYDAADLKKLFTDESQRAQIDASRSGNYSATELQKAEEVSVSGYMTRSDGKNVVWVNGENTMQDSNISGVKVYPDAIRKNKKVPVKVDGRSVYVKPGESWSESTGKIKDNY